MNKYIDQIPPIDKVIKMLHVEGQSKEYKIAKGKYYMKWDRLHKFVDYFLACMVYAVMLGLGFLLINWVIELWQKL